MLNYMIDENVEISYTKFNEFHSDIKSHSAQYEKPLYVPEQ